jgi:hypothetical protein
VVPEIFFGIKTCKEHLNILERSDKSIPEDKLTSYAKVEQVVCIKASDLTSYSLAC